MLFLSISARDRLGGVWGFLKCLRGWRGVLWLLDCSAVLLGRSGACLGRSGAPLGRLFGMLWDAPGTLRSVSDNGVSELMFFQESQAKPLSSSS